MPKDQEPSSEIKKNPQSTKTQTFDEKTDVSARHIIGHSVNAVTNIINNNIVAARYGTFASIALLTAYGIVKTPLFFRFKRIADIPASYFNNRKTIHGRIIHVVEQDANANVNQTSKYGGKEKPIVCLIRHLSPAGRLLHRSAFDFMTRMSPHSQVHKKKMEDSKELLKVEIAGIKAPPSYFGRPGKEDPNEWLKNLAASRARVSCNLLSRRAQKLSESDKESFVGEHHTYKNNTRKKSETPQFDLADTCTEETAICKMTFRPGVNIFRKDLGLSLVSFGRANVASGMHIEEGGKATFDGSESIRDIEADVKYLQGLEDSEFNAVKSRKGMWENEKVRDSRPDLVEAANFDISAGFWSKLWRRITKE